MISMLEIHNTLKLQIIKANNITIIPVSIPTSSPLHSFHKTKHLLEIYSTDLTIKDE